MKKKNEFSRAADTRGPHEDSLQRETARGGGGGGNPARAGDFVKETSNFSQITTKY